MWSRILAFDLDLTLACYKGQLGRWNRVSPSILAFLFNENNDR